MRRKLHVKTEYNGCSLDAEFHNKMTIFCSDPRAGREVLACVAHFCRLRQISCVFLPDEFSPGEDCRDFAVLREKCAGKEVALLDRVEGYLGRGRLAEIRRECGMVFLILNARKVTPEFIRKNPAACYNVWRQDGEILLEPWNPPRTREAYIRTFGRKKIQCSGKDIV